MPLEPDAELDGLDAAKIFAAPDDPADWPAWREALTRWRAEAADRIEYDDGAYRAPEFAWTRGCFSVALVWLWDELLYDHEAGRFTPERFCAESEREFGGFDGIVLWHAYPVIGIDERNQFDFYRDVPGIRELVDELQARGLRVFVNYNPWDVGTRREPVADDVAIAELVRELGADGVFLDTMKEAQPGLRAALDAVRPGIALEGESTLPLARICDHHLSWAQWFSDSAVPGVLRARWFEQRHMLHHTRRWNRDHAEELHSAWLNGVGMLVWENVFGAWVGWNERDKELLRAMLSVQRQHAELLATGEWTPLAAASPDDTASSRRAGRTARRRCGRSRIAAKRIAGAVGELEVELPALGIAAFVGSEQVMVAGGGDASFPAREAVRVPAPVVRVDAVPEGFAAVEPRPLTAVFRRRETGTYGEAPYVEEWKPLPPRLHDFVEVERPAPRGRFAISVARRADRPRPRRGARVRRLGRRAAARPRTSGSSPPRRALLDFSGPRVWNWTESEHSDGRTRFAILKGGSDWEAEGSDWYVDGGPQEPALLAQAAAPRRRHGPVAADRLPAGGRPAVKPLDGIRVVEAATLFAAPFAGMLLGDFGAEVIKIEHPRRPDPARGHGPSKDGEGLWFKSLARNKRLVTLDLSKPEGADIFLRLAAEADVVLENFRPGTLERWGLGWDELSAVNPRLVLARVTGFGQTGPYAHRPGFGTLAEAMSGFAALNGEPDGPPLLPPLALADGIAGLATAFAVLAALRAREADRGRPGRRHVARRAADGAARAAAGRVRPARRAAAADRKPVEPQRSAQRLPHRRRRVGRGLGQRRLGGGTRSPARRAGRPRRAAVVRDRRGARPARRGDRRGGGALDRRARPRHGPGGLRGGRGGDRADLRRERRPRRSPAGRDRCDRERRRGSRCRT